MKFKHLYITYVNPNDQLDTLVLQYKLRDHAVTKKWCERLESLQNQINYWIDPVNKTDKMVEVVELFYDQPTTF